MKHFNDVTFQNKKKLHKNFQFSLLKYQCHDMAGIPEEKI